MKKKILFGLFVILTVVTLTGCGKKEDKNLKEITLKDDGFGTTVIKYKQDKDYEIKEETGGRFQEKIIKSKSENFTMDIYHTESSETSYNVSKENRKESNGFKEYTWNGMSGYIYNSTKDAVRFNVLLKTVDGKAKVLFGSIDSIEYQKSDLLELFNSEDFQKMMNSITFTE